MVRIHTCAKRIATFTHALKDNLRGTKDKKKSLTSLLSSAAKKTMTLKNLWPLEELREKEELKRMMIYLGGRGYMVIGFAFK